MPESSTWTRVLITSNGTGLQNFLSSPSISSFVAQVKQNQVVVRASYKDIRKNSEIMVILIHQKLLIYSNIRQGLW